jgi:hypothetical protein
MKKLKSSMKVAIQMKSISVQTELRKPRKKSKKRTQNPKSPKKFDIEVNLIKTVHLEEDKDLSESLNQSNTKYLSFDLEDEKPAKSLVNQGMQTNALQTPSNTLCIQTSSPEIHTQDTQTEPLPKSPTVPLTESKSTAMSPTISTPTDVLPSTAIPIAIPIAIPVAIPVAIPIAILSTPADTQTIKEDVTNNDTQTPTTLSTPADTQTIKEDVTNNDTQTQVIDIQVDIGKVIGNVSLIISIMNLVYFYIVCMYNMILNR